MAVYSSTIFVCGYKSWGEYSIASLYNEIQVGLHFLFVFYTEKMIWPNNMKMITI